MGDALNRGLFGGLGRASESTPPESMGGWRRVGDVLCSPHRGGGRGPGGGVPRCSQKPDPPPPLSSLCSCPWPGLSPSPSPSAPPFSVSPHVVPGEQQGLAEAHCGRALSSGVSEPGPAGPLPGLGAGEDR